MDTVYVGMCADLIHYGHVNIINVAANYGKVIIGLLTDEAISTYKDSPIMSYDKRKEVIGAFRSVYLVVPQETLSYKNNLELLNPNYVVHGDDWKFGKQEKIRSEVIDTISKWGGLLIEPCYTEGISSTALREHYFKDERGRII